MDTKKLEEKISTLETRLAEVETRNSKPGLIAGLFSRTQVLLGILISAIVSGTLLYAVTIPNTFTDGTAIVAADMNANFTTLASQITTNEGAIGTNADNITTNATGISTNSSNITTNATNISANTAAVKSNFIFLNRGVLSFSATIYLNRGTSTENEVDSQIVLPHDGSLISILATARTNDIDGDTIFTIRLNGVDSGSTITIPAGTTGVFSSSVSVPFSQGDLLSVSAVSGGTGGVIENGKVAVGFN